MHNRGKEVRWKKAEFILDKIHYNSKLQLEAWDEDYDMSDDCIGKSLVMHIRDFAVGGTGP